MKKLLIVVVSVMLFAVGGYFGALLSLKFLSWKIDEDQKNYEARRVSRRGYSGYVPRPHSRVN